MIGWIVGILVVAFLLVLVIRALRFKPPVEEPVESAEWDIDKEAVVEHLAAMVRCKTVSRADTSLEDEAEFDKFRNLLRELYPTVYEKCQYDTFGRSGIRLTLAGREAGGPSVFMAHYDVVPPVEEAWDHPPFCGEVFDGELWGRGTLDTKITLCGALEAAELLLRQGFVPKNDMVFAFAGDEETTGLSAQAAAAEYKEKGIVPSFVLDEGGAVVQNVFPGVKAPCAVVGTAEKGVMNVTFSVEGHGGHASTPPRVSNIRRLADAVGRMERKPFRTQLCRPVAEMFDTLGRHSTFLYRLIFANLKVFMPLLAAIYRKPGGEIHALLHTTVAFTQMQGSDAVNVMPPRASVRANLRLLGEDSVEVATAYLRKTVADARITVTPDGGSMDPAPVSVTDCEQFRQLKRAIRCTWPEALVSPYIMLQCSDSRHYSRISPYVYRFSAMALSQEERSRIHGNNERVPLDTIYDAVRFYLNILSQR